MIKLVVGLGNPGQQYIETRHNVGFWFVDELARSYHASWTLEKKFKGQVATIVVNGKTLRLLKPVTFMNLSGQSVAEVMRYYQVAITDCLVVHDELDFDVGVVRLKLSGGHAGHNGLRSIIACLGGSDFKRLRFGIGRPVGRQPVADYVLSSALSQDKEKIYSAIQRAQKVFGLLLNDTVDLFVRGLIAE